MEQPLELDNKKLMEEFGAEPIDNLKEKPKFRAFEIGSAVSHRDFNIFFQAIKKGEPCAIVSGLNPSAVLHLGHKVVFDINLFFQKEYHLPVFIPLSDDESYLAGKVKSQEEALGNAKKLAKELLAYGFDPKKTFFIIDQIYTNIYNLAIKLSKKINLSEIKATYGYKNEENIGLHFYPAVQAAHVLFPMEIKKAKHVLVPIGPDEDAHLRIARDIASRAGYNKTAVLHVKFLPGIDGGKMSKSKGNAIFLSDDEKTVRSKINKAFSGGQKTMEEHKQLGGNPDVDVAFLYLKNLFLSKEESENLAEKYRNGEISSGEMKKLCIERILSFLKKFQENLKKVSEKDVEGAILRNER